MLFYYEAFNKNGVIVTGEVDASSEKDVVLYLEGKELIPSKIKNKSQKAKFNINLDLAIFERIKDTDIIFLVRNLATSIKAGLSISEALDILVNETKNPLMREVIISARSAVQSGRPLSEAFAEHKRYFPPVFLGLLKAGEVASQLDKTLDELSSHLIREYALVKRVKSAMVYPTLLLVASAAVIVFLLVFVLPRLARTFLASGAELPAITKFLLGVSAFMSKYFIVIIIVLVLTIAVLMYLRRTEAGKRFIGMILFRTPLVSDLIKKVALVRFTRTLGSLLSGATPVLDALRTSSEAVGNDFYRFAILDIVEKVRAGIPLSKALQTHKDMFPSLLTSLVAVGERTGNLEYVLGNFSSFYDEEVQTKLKDLTTLFEPILLLIMGLIIGTVAISMLLPIYQLVGRFT